MNWYLLLAILHVMAALAWFGHMFFWSLFAGFATKAIEPRETGNLVRDLGLRWGGFGWPSLIVLAVTGILMVNLNQITVHHVVSGEFLHEPLGRVMAVKLFLVGCMVLYQFFVGHRSAPRLIYLNLFAALVIVVLSILRVRSPW
jgi:uncharacterized membrane protein